MSHTANVLLGLAFFLSFAYTVAALTFALGSPIWFAALVGVGASVAVGVWVGRVAEE